MPHIPDPNSLQSVLQLAKPPRKTRLRRRSRAADGFHDLIDASLDHLMGNIGPTLHGSMEGIHELRAGLRGVRAVLQLFNCHLNATTVRRFNASLRRCGQVFGAARDWDVFCHDMLPVAATGGLSVKALRDLSSVARDRQQAAHTAVADTIRGRAFAALVLELAAWTDAGAAHPSTLGDKHMGRRLTRLAPGLLGAVARKVRRRAQHVDRLTAQELHSLRKSLRKLRYDVQSFAGLFPHGAVQTYGKRCDAVLKILGVINDAAVTRRLAASLVTNSRPDLADPAAALKRCSQVRGREARLELHGALKKLLKTPEFWS